MLLGCDLVVGLSLVGSDSVCAEALRVTVNQRRGVLERGQGSCRKNENKERRKSCRVRASTTGGEPSRYHAKIHTHADYCNGNRVVNPTSKINTSYSNILMDNVECTILT